MNASQSPISVSRVATIKNGGRLQRACFSPDGGSVITSSDAGCERWNVATGERLATLAPDDADYLTAEVFWEQKYGEPSQRERAAWLAKEAFNGFDDYVLASPSGRFIAAGSSSGYLHLLDTTANTQISLLGHSTTMNNHMHQNSIEFLGFDASSSFLISMAEEDDAPLLWDLLAPARPGQRGKRGALLFDQPVRLNDVTLGAIDTIRFSPTEPRFVAIHRGERAAIVWEISRRDAACVEVG